MNDTATDITTGLSCPQCGAPVWMPPYADLAVCAWCGSNLVREWLGWEGGAGPAGVRPAVRATGETAADRTAVGAHLPAGAAPAGTAPVTADGPAPGASHALRSVSCPQCAGVLSVKEGRRVLSCGRCGVRLLVRGHGGFSRWYFPLGIDRLGAARAAAAWLAGHPGIAEGARSARLSPARLVFVPIWEHRALVAGWEFGDRLRTQTRLVGTENGERLELELRRVGVKESRLHERRFYQAACDLGRLDANRPRFSGRESLLPLLAGELDPEAVVWEPEGTAGEIAERGRRSAMQPVSNAASPDSHAFLLRETVSLLFFPFWVLHYQVGGRAFRVVVDGRSGTINSATAPAARTSARVMAGLRTAGLGIAAVVLVLLGVAFQEARASLLAAAVIVSVAAVFYVLRSRVPGEVEYHEPFSS